VHYTTLSGTTNVPNSGMVEIPVQPLCAAGALPDETVTLTLVLTNGYLVNTSSASATMKIYPPRPAGMAVAIHDSGWTRFNGLSSTTNWNYFVLPESVKEALRSDGTPFVVVGDGDIANGALLTTNGLPTYPILICLVAEVIRDEEIARLTNYVAAGGFIFAGSSSFTRGTNGGFRSDFALANQMGVHCAPGVANWVPNTYFARQSDHRLVNHIPEPWVTWRMPSSADEISWGTCANNRRYTNAHQIWAVSATNAEVLATGDGYLLPYLAVKPYGSGYFIYDAALQPLMAHGGNGPGMYAYMIFRRAIEWAFESAQRPVVRLSPWPYQYDAAFMARHDLENSVVEIANVSGSAQYEVAYGAKGDYYFCTGAITNEGVDTASIISGLVQAAGSYGATIGPHNGGLPNPRLSADTGSPCYALPYYYQYFHWGPDEAYDLAGGYAYASNSVAISFAQVETWVTNQPPDIRVWVVPYFNGTREQSYQLQEQLNVNITGEQKLGPFPHWTLSTGTDGKRYSFLSEPVSDWFVGPQVAQVLGPWQGSSTDNGLHTPDTMQEGVDFYYSNGFLINFYAHSLTGVLAGTDDDQGQAAGLMSNYVAYCANSVLHPRIWPANARDVYNWWLNRSTAQVTAHSYPTNGSHSVATVAITGAQSTNTAIEILAVGFGSAFVSQLLTNGVAATTNSYRTTGGVVKVLVGTAITNVQVEYFPGPSARDDAYTMVRGQALTVGAAAGVLSNDWSGTWAGLSAIANGGPSHGTLALNLDGSFTYTPTNGFWGTECFTYQATDGVNDFGTATVTILVANTGALFGDDFRRCTATALNPWQVNSGTWALGNGAIQGNSTPGNYGLCFFSTNWTSYSVEAMIQFQSNAYGGGLGGRLDSSTGRHYAAWIYPDNSQGGSNVLKLVKSSGWNSFGYDGTPYASMAQTNLPPVGTGWHLLRLACSNTVIRVDYDGTNIISMPDADTDQPVYSSGGVNLDMWTHPAGGVYAMSVSNLIVRPLP
jgi:hypothetical protein